MSVLPGPKPPPARAPRKQAIDPLPQTALHALVSGIPGPHGETEAQSAARFDAQLAEILSYKPRDLAEAMMASHAMLLRLVADHTIRQAADPAHSGASAEQARAEAKELENLAADMAHRLGERQARPQPKLDPTVFAQLGLDDAPLPDPDDPAQPDQAVSGLIVPLHPAPTTLQ